MIDASLLTGFNGALNRTIMSIEIILCQDTKGNINLDAWLETITIWLTHAKLCELFQKLKAFICEHIKYVFEEGVSEPGATVRNFRTVQIEGNLEVVGELDYFNRNVIISLEYEVEFAQSTHHRLWSIQRHIEDIIIGFAINDDRFKSGSLMNYYNDLRDRIRKTLI